MNKRKDKGKGNFLQGITGRVETLKWPFDLIFIALFFILTIIYFIFENYLFMFQGKQSLFVFSGSYLRGFLNTPGGALDIAGNFLTQFYFKPFAGLLILVSVLTLTAIVLHFINRKIFPGHPLSSSLLLVPSCFLLMMQTHYYHLMEYNLGYLIVLVCFLASISQRSKKGRLAVLVLFPLLYYVSGGYAWIFAAMYVLYILAFEEGTQKYIRSGILIAVIAITLLISDRLIFLQPFEKLLKYPLPNVNDITHRKLFFMLTGFLVLYPVICKAAIATGGKWLQSRLTGLLLPVLILGATTVFLIKKYDPQTASVVRLEQLVFEGKWKDVVSYQEDYPSRNQIGEYFYNLALSETDQLCDRLFSAPQDFGTGSLILPWDEKYLAWGAYFYYSTGLFNEAHRWAYEEMVVYGYRPWNIRMLINTSLLNGDYRMAAKYNALLRRTINFRKEADNYEKLINNPGLIGSDKELGPRLKLRADSVFFMQTAEPQNNLALILGAGPVNRKAFEYAMAWNLLSKNVETIVNNLSDMKAMGYKRIPRNIEEAVLIYYNSQNSMPNLGGLTISSETMTRFNQYFTTYVSARQNPATLEATMKKNFGTTFWYYFHFK